MSKWKRSEHWIDVFEYTEKLPSGMILYMQLFPQEEYTNNIYYGVYLGIYRKRKHIYTKDLSFQQTGRDGITSLIRAKKALLKFIENPMVPPYRNKKITIVVRADNGQRRRVYERGLRGVYTDIVKLDGVSYLRIPIEDK